MTKYRQITSRLRVQRGAGNADLVSERPRNSESGPFTDTEEAPTLVTFDELCQVDIPFLLQIGAIAEYTAPKKTVKAEKAAKPSGTVVDDSVIADHGTHGLPGTVIDDSHWAV